MEFQTELIVQFIKLSKLPKKAKTQIKIKEMINKINIKLIYNKNFTRKFRKLFQQIEFRIFFRSQTVEFYSTFL
jgi:hypothetical protein